MFITVVTTKGQIVIPSKIRKKMNIKRGMKLLVEERDNEIVLIPLNKSHFANLAGKLPTGGKLAEILLKERKNLKTKK